ncbi:MAG: hypothetical protein WCD11_08190 [Solirubrobacteraceae bacterium]
MNEAERALINECRRRVQELKDDPDVTTVDGRNYRAQRVTRALENREHSGELTAAYVKKTIRRKGRTGRSAGWDAMVRGGRLDASFEYMTLNDPDPLVRGWFNDEDRAIAARALKGVR